MKKPLLLIALCIVFFSGCDSSTTSPTTPEGEVLLAEYPGDSIVTAGAGGGNKTSTISSSSLDFTNADSMRIQVTYRGTTNNTVSAALRIGYIFSSSPDSNIYVYTILNTEVTNSEKTLDVTIGSPKVNKSFIYNMNLFVASGTGGNLYFKDLKIYKK